MHDSIYYNGEKMYTIQQQIQDKNKNWFIHTVSTGAQYLAPG